MTSAYESHLLNVYLNNVAAKIDYRSPEAGDFIEWITDDLKKFTRRNPCADKASADPLDELGREIVAEMERKQPWSEDRPRPYRVNRLVSDEMLRKVRKVLGDVLSAGPPKPDRTALRLRRLARAAELDSLEADILEMLLRYQTSDAIESLIDGIFDSAGPRTRMNVSSNTLPLLFDRPQNKIQARLKKDAPLVRSGLVEIDNYGVLEIPRRLQRLAFDPGNDRSDIVRLLFDSASPTELEWTDFDHIEKGREHIEALLNGALQKRAKGLNILLYGPPGTGKTEFCKVLAERLGVTLYCVGEADDGGSEPSRDERLQELTIAQRLLAKNRKSLLLFDEMEDLLDSHSGFPLIFPTMQGERYSQGKSKVFMHRLLEETPVPILWTMNNAGSVDRAILRRMRFALELRPPNAAIRARVWMRQLAKNDIEATPADVDELAREFEATPAIAAGATAAARIAGGDLATVRYGVRSLSRLLSCDRPPQKAPAEFELGLIQADTDPEALATRITETARRNFSLCLQGPPGTGKSAFVRYLAERLGMEVMHKRASDLKSMWVGQTEKLIARAFAEARDSEAFLIFDEADSLLSDRRNAVRNWEVSQVNEMLTWMESHPFPFACTTNFVDRLDQATSRRFTFKIALDYLTSEQARFAFGKFFSLEAPAGLNSIAALTPGDFAVVRKKAEILGYLQESEVLAEMLRAECEAKPNRPKSIGFYS